MKIPYLDLKAQYQSIKAEIDEAVRRTIDNTAFCLGPEVTAFEKDFARVHGVQHASGFNSGTSALHVALRVLDIGPGDEVITTPYTFIATSWAIAYVGARIVYVDVEEDTFNIDLKLLERALTPKTKLILPVHLYGHPFDVSGVQAFCEKHKLPFVEDAAQAHLAEYQGKPVGGFGCMSCFSFYPGKNLGAFGEGGALLTNNEAYDKRARALREHGSTQRYYHDEVGYNYRMEGIQGAVLAVKLKHLKAWTEARRQVAKWYHSFLSDAGVQLPTERSDARSVWHLYVIRHPKRDALKEHLEKNGIGCGVHYPVPLHLQKCFQHLGYKSGDFPVAEKATKECLSLPIYPELKREQVEYIAAKVKEFTKS